MHDILDIHTHNRNPDHRAIININPWDDIPAEGLYSIGLHPWDTTRNDCDTLMMNVKKLAHDPRIVMIGETGIDKLRGASMDIQINYARIHAMIAEETNKPLLLHVVRGYGEIIRLKREILPSVPWIIHGFRGKPELARQILREGMRISLGEKFNHESAAIIPDEMLHLESDTSTVPFKCIINNVNNTRNSCSQHVENRK